MGGAHDRVGVSRTPGGVNRMGPDNCCGPGHGAAGNYRLAGPASGSVRSSRHPAGGPAAGDRRHCRVSRNPAGSAAEPRCPGRTAPYDAGRADRAWGRRLCHPANQGLIPHRCTCRGGRGPRPRTLSGPLAPVDFAASGCVGASPDQPSHAARDRAGCGDWLGLRISGWRPQQDRRCSIRRRRRTAEFMSPSPGWRISRVFAAACRMRDVRQPGVG